MLNKKIENKAEICKQTEMRYIYENDEYKCHADSKSTAVACIPP